MIYELNLILLKNSTTQIDRLLYLSVLPSRTFGYFSKLNVLSKHINVSSLRTLKYFKNIYRMETLRKLFKQR